VLVSLITLLGQLLQRATPGNTRSRPVDGAFPPARNLAGLDVFAMIDKLAELRGRNILNAAEFDARKTELLARL